MKFHIFFGVKLDHISQLKPFSKLLNCFVLKTFFIPDMKSDGYGLSDIFGFLQTSFWTIIGLSLGVPILICFATNDFCIVYYLLETLVSKILKVKLVSWS